MKMEISIEEKAKRYDEAIKKAKYYYDEGKTIEFANYIASDIFPELKESEDEKIRKSLAAYFAKFKQSDMWDDDFSFGDILAWLEKQGEQKPVWSEEDSPYYDDICEILINLLRSETANVNKTAVQKDLDWLNSLKDRVQPQPKPAERSDEDENMINSIIRELVHQYNEEISQGTEVKIKWLKNRLKSLRPQNRWKPSEEHYELEEFAKIVRSNLTGISKAVQELFEARYLQLTGNKMYQGFKD